MIGMSVLVGLAACAGPPGGNATSSLADGPRARDDINAYRARSALGALRLDPALSEAARRQSLAMAQAGTLSHDIAGALRGRLAVVGVSDVIAAENIGRGTADVTRAILSWRGSAAHDRNLRLAEATRLGLARADAPGGPWWTLILAGDPRAGYRWSL